MEEEVGNEVEPEVLTTEELTGILAGGDVTKRADTVVVSEVREEDDVPDGTADELFAVVAGVATTGIGGMGGKYIISTGSSGDPKLSNKSVCTLADLSDRFISNYGMNDNTVLKSNKSQKETRLTISRLMHRRRIPTALSIEESHKYINEMPKEELIFLNNCSEISVDFYRNKMRKTISKFKDNRIRMYNIINTWENELIDYYYKRLLEVFYANITISNTIKDLIPVKSIILNYL